MHKSILDFATASVAVLCHTNIELHGVCNAASSCMPAYTHTYTLCISMEKEECIQVLRDTLIFPPALTKCSFFLSKYRTGGVQNHFAAGFTRHTSLHSILLVPCIPEVKDVDRT